jgi:Fe-S cluster assembly protein SufB
MAFEYFQKKRMPTWGPSLIDIDFQNIHYYAKHTKKPQNRWDDIPDDIKETYARIGLPEAEQKHLMGIGAQYDSEIVYHNIKKEIKAKGVIFCAPEEALKKYPGIFRKYFNTVIPYVDNKFSALNTAVWSGGSFIYVPENVEIEVPLQSYFRINLPSFGQFERTLIIADKNSRIHYVEGCTAPIYSKDSLHAAVVEIVALEGAFVKYSTVQNWSKNVYNLVTKRAFAYKNAKVEWIDGNLGSKITMKYPSIYLKDEGAHGEVLSLAFSTNNQNQDTGAKIIHQASNTSSRILSKSVSKDGGISSYRGLISVKRNVENVKSKINCDALLIDSLSQSNTYPYMDILSDYVQIEHEASISTISEDQMYYLISRGFDKEEASLLIISGFLEPAIKELPMEYAVELNKLIQLEISNSVG